MYRVAAFKVANALQDPLYLLLTLLHPPERNSGLVGQMDRIPPCFLETGPYTTREPRGWGCGGWWSMVELSLKLLSPLLLVPVSQASLPLNPQSAPNDPLPWGDS